MQTPGENEPAPNLALSCQEKRDLTPRNHQTVSQTKKSPMIASSNSPMAIESPPEDINASE